MNNIKRFRIEKGYTQKELAHKVNISVGYLSHLEHDNKQNPSFQVILKLSNALEKTIEEVFNI